MAFFTSKSHIIVHSALIGEYADNDAGIVWNHANWEYAWDLYVNGVLEDRGYKVVNSTLYRLFYLPGTTDSY